MDIQTTNFENFTQAEYIENLARLGIVNHTSLVGTQVYYVLKQYGKHTVLKWDAVKAEYLLDLDGQKFWSNPFRIHTF